MFLSRAGVRSANVPRVKGALVWLTALLFSFALAACSSTGSAPQPTSWYATEAPGAMAGMVPMRAGPPVEVEDDGIEAQRPPRARVRALPDDPAEPYSPNYGSVPRA
jgi:hypothetical protein